MKPEISVILPVFNGEKYLKEAIESVINQSFKNFEFIIINDGSEDNSLKIIQEYKNKDNRIIVIHHENKGLISCLNEGLSIAKGKYIARMDQDDISLTDRFDAQYHYMEENIHIGVCGSWIEVFYKQGRKKRVVKYPNLYDEAEVLLLFSVPLAHPTAFIRKEVMDKYQLFYSEQYKNAEDYELWSRVIKVSKIVNIQKVLLRYRYHEQSMTRKAEHTSDTKRYQTIKSIFSTVLLELNVNNNEQENLLHFTVAFNERIERAAINLGELNCYFNKLLIANRLKKRFNEQCLMKLLSKKFLVVIYYQFKQNVFDLRNIIKSRFFYFGLLNQIKKI